MKVAKKLRYAIMAGGKIDTKREPDVLRERAVVTEQWIEETNARTKENGVYYEVDEEATKEYEEQSAKELKQRQDEASMRKELAASSLANALGVSKPKQQRQSKKKEDK